jgi:uncharacterized protein (TIGR03437 family)
LLPPANSLAPNTWVEIKGSGLSLTGDSRIWKATDFAGTQMPQLDRISATVNGKAAYLCYISPTQVNILTPPDAVSGAVQVVFTNNGAVSASVTAQAQPLSPSFFVFGAGPYVVAEHLIGSYVGPSNLYPPFTSPAKAGEYIALFANGCGPTSVPVVSGASSQSGILTTLPVVKIGGIAATVQFARPVAPGEFQFNVVVPSGLASGDQPLAVTYAEATTQTGVTITIQ